MYRGLAAIVLAMLQLTPSVVPLPTEEQRYNLFGDYLEALRVQASIPGMAVAVVGQDDIVWERAFGQQDLERGIAARPDTPFRLDGLTELFTTALVLRCVEEGYLSLSDQIGQYSPAAPEAGLTIRNVLTHTTGPPNNLVFSYRPSALSSLAPAISGCTGESFRETLADLFDRLAMINSVPGADIVDVVPPQDGTTPESIVRYTDILTRLARPYALAKTGQPAISRATDNLTPSTGAIGTVRDFARFDVALRKGVLVEPDTLAAAWQAPVDRTGQRLPHGIGWFVQTYKGDKVLWQFGVSDGASSSLVMTVPSRGFTVVLLANSDGLVNPFDLANGDLTTSPFGRLLLGAFFR